MAHGFKPLGAGGEYAAARGAAGGGAAADRHAQALGALSVDGCLWPRAVCLRPRGGFRALHPAAHGHFPDGAQKGEAVGFGGVRCHFRGGFRAVLRDHGDQRLRAGNDDARQDDHAALRKIPARQRYFARFAEPVSEHGAEAQGFPAHRHRLLSGGGVQRHCVGRYDVSIRHPGGAVRLVQALPRPQAAGAPGERGTAARRWNVDSGLDVRRHHQHNDGRRGGQPQQHSLLSVDSLRGVCALADGQAAAHGAGRDGRDDRNRFCGRVRRVFHRRGLSDGDGQYVPLRRAGGVARSMGLGLRPILFDHNVAQRRRKGHDGAGDVCAPD